MPSIQDFMDSSLVIWIQTFRPTGETLDFEELCDGVFLNDVLHQIDERPIMESINRSAIDVNARIQNWRCLLQNISNFYQETLQQLIVQKLPDIVMIAREPEKDTSIEELTKILKLLLGSAVQCDKKEGYISIIQDLDKDIQQTLVDYIKEVTNQATFMFDVELENLNISEIHEIFHNLKSLVTQRDELIEAYQDLIQEREYYRCLVDDYVKDISLPSHMDTQHVTGELMLYKNQIKCLQQEIEETNYSFSELKSDKEEYEFNYGRLLTENERLSEELRTLGINRDELDILQEQAHLGSVFETENFHLKAKVAELEFYKSRTEELRQDNTALIDSRARFEEQLEKSQKREENLIDEVVECQINLDELKTDQDNNRKRIQALMEEITCLEKEKIHLLNRNESISKNKDTDYNYAGSNNVAVDAFRGRAYSLSDEILSETLSEELSQLKAENESLLRRLRQAEEDESVIMESKWRITEIQREKQYYKRELQKCKTKLEHETNRFISLEEKNRELLHAQERKEEEISMLQDSNEHQVETLEMEIKELQDTCVNLRGRNDLEPEQQIQYIQQENIEMFTSVQDLTTRLNRMKYSNKILRKSCDMLKEDVDRSAAYGGDNERLRRENYDLRTKVAASRVAVELSDSYEKKNLKLEIENKKLSRLVDILRTTVAQVDPKNRVSYHYITSL